LKAIATLYKNELLEAVIPFWENHSVDRAHGGYFTCLDRTGNVYDTDKFLWLQARQVWMFATLHKKVDPKKEWKEIALTGASFLEKHGRNTHGDWYFSLDKQGRPLVQAYNIFSDCFAAMAFSAIHEFTGKEEHALIAKTTFERIWQRQDHPKGIYEKAFPGTRPMRNFALPMILCNLSMEMAPLLGTEKVRAITDTVVHSVMEDFYQKETGLILENIGMDGQFVDSFEGRLLNPGHAIEAMWFVMNIALQNQDEALFKEAETRMYHQLEMGWDSEYGGIYYFMGLQRPSPPTIGA
jgi:N-acylglucosamine 2-epimerase